MNANAALSTILIAILAAGCFDSDEIICDDETTGPEAELEADTTTEMRDGNEPGCSGSIGCSCEPLGCADGLACIGGTCGPAPVGQLGFACEAGTDCDEGLVCVTGAESSVCALPAGADLCEHGTAIESDGIDVEGGCVPACDFGGVDCQWLACNAEGFCASPA